MVMKLKSTPSVLTIHVSRANRGDSHGRAKSVLACHLPLHPEADVDLDRGGSLEAVTGLLPSLAFPAKASVTLWAPCFREDLGTQNNAQEE